MDVGEYIHYHAGMADGVRGKPRSRRRPHTRSDQQEREELFHRRYRPAGLPSAHQHGCLSVCHHQTIQTVSPQEHFDEIPPPLLHRHLVPLRWHLHFDCVDFTGDVRQRS